MWKPNQPGSTTPQTPEPVRPIATPTQTFEPSTPAAVKPVSSPAAAAASGEQATIGKSLIIKGDLSGSESLFIDGKVEGAITLPGYGGTVGRNGQVAANISAVWPFSMRALTLVPLSRSCARIAALPRAAATMSAR